jgi:uncharacterized OsmC-like protein
MKISATIKNGFHQQETIVQTNEASKELQIAARTSGFGSSVNGAELLLLSLATCFCNDIYREAEKRNIQVSGVEVVATGEFGREGEPGFNFKYSAHIISDASPSVIEELINYTDQVAEIHNTLRKGVNIVLTK